MFCPTTTQTKTSQFGPAAETIHMPKRRSTDDVPLTAYKLTKPELNDFVRQNHPSSLRVEIHRQEIWDGAYAGYIAPVTPADGSYISGWLMGRAALLQRLSAALNSGEFAGEASPQPETAAIPAVSTPPSHVLTPDELSEKLNLSTATLSRWRRCGLGPKWFKVAHRVRYLWRDVQAFIAEQTHD